MLRLSIIAFFTLLAAVTVQAEEKIADVLTDRSMKMSKASDRAKMVVRIAAIEKKRRVAAHNKARRLGLPIRTEYKGNIADLVDFIGDEPLYITTMNADAAISTGANLLLELPYSLDGAGITVGVWDTGTGNPAHQEFLLPGGGSRLRQMDTTSLATHSAHIAGTIAAAGVDPDARGMAPAARVDAYSKGGDLSEMTSRAATAPDQLDTHIYLSNHSYGPLIGWWAGTWFGDGQDANAAEYRFGRYENISRNQDALAYNAPYYLIFRSAGNEREDNPEPGESVTLAQVDGEVADYDPLLHPPGDGVYRNGYETIAPDAIGKNIVTVAAVEDAVTDGFRDIAMASLTNFSSTGPADDGRIKPDLVANGAELYSTLDGTADYDFKTGTSMASPNACGSAALLMQLYDRLFGGAMRASTLKGLMLHTADDLGNPGPDYQFGWGLVNIRRAADLLIYHDSFPDRMRLTEDELSSTDPIKSYSFEWDGVSPLRATLSWTDPAGEAVANDVHDSRVPTLVNDLNLKLIAPDGSEYFPYVMPFVGTWTTESMALPATTGVNHTDNVEQIRLEGAAQSGTWRAEVSYLGNLTDGQQHYSLLISEDADA
ncbi:MAG: S8 family serine peptidase, partial [Opitutales bacterium]